MCSPHEEFRSGSSFVQSLTIHTARALVRRQERVNIYCDAPTLLRATPSRI